MSPVLAETVYGSWLKVSAVPLTVTTVPDAELSKPDWAKVICCGVTTVLLLKVQVQLPKLNPYSSRPLLSKP